MTRPTDIVISLRIRADGWVRKLFVGTLAVVLGAWVGVAFIGGVAALLKHLT